MADTTVTGSVTKVCSDPPGFTVARTPPLTPIAFADVSDRQYQTALAAYSGGKVVTVTYPEGGGQASKVESP